MKKVSFIMFVVFKLFCGYTGGNDNTFFPVFDCGMIMMRKD